MLGISPKNSLLNKRKNIKNVSIKKSQSSKKLTSSKNDYYIATLIGSNQMQSSINESNEPS